MLNTRRVYVLTRSRWHATMRLSGPAERKTGHCPGPLVFNVKMEKATGAARPFEPYGERAESPKRQFSIDADAISKIRVLEKQRGALLGMSKSIDAPILPLTYDDDINTPDKHKTLEKLRDFLEINDSPAWQPGDCVKSRDQDYHKLVNDDLRSVIENYDEIAGLPDFQKYLS